jgi:nucleoside triphosphate diphosphatase
MSAGSEFERLVTIMDRLRGEGGCPWDRAQDLRSLRPYLIEEAYEVLEAMDAVVEGGPMRAMVTELGDLLFQIVFHARLAKERGDFTIEDVIRAIADKLESRHPHVFGNLAVSGAAEVLANWAKFKERERLASTGRPGSALDGVPEDAPALLRAERVSDKAAHVGFDFADAKQVRAKVDEELKELDAALETGNVPRIQEELGDLLFAVANLARFARAPSEDALRGAINRFSARFRHVEQRLRESGRTPKDCRAEEMDRLWNEAKAATR